MPTRSPILFLFTPTVNPLCCHPKPAKDGKVDTERATAFNQERERAEGETDSRLTKPASSTPHDRNATAGARYNAGWFAAGGQGA